MYYSYIKTNDTTMILSALTCFIQGERKVPPFLLHKWQLQEGKQYFRPLWNAFFDAYRHHIWIKLHILLLFDMYFQILVEFDKIRKIVSSPLLIVVQCIKKGGNFKTKKFFNYPETFLYCLYSSINAIIVGFFRINHHFLSLVFHEFVHTLISWPFYGLILSRMK